MKELKDMSLEELWQLFPIVLKAHSPDYATWYGEESKHILHALKSHELCRINHVGSTAVDSLIAKPIIDILLEMPSTYERDAVASQLQSANWIVMAQDDVAQTLSLNKGYTSEGFEDKVFHLHIRPLGDPDELYFRDYLRQHPNIAAQYGLLKQVLKVKFEHDRDGYTNAKTKFVHDITKMARKEFAGRYLPDDSIRI